MADYVIGHMPKDSYEKQALLYPYTLRREYAKAAGRLNVFTKISNSLSGKDDPGQLLARLSEQERQIKQLLDGGSVEFVAGRHKNMAESARISQLEDS